VVYPEPGLSLGIFSGRPNMDAILRHATKGGKARDVAVFCAGALPRAWLMAITAHIL
jgi:hypothetical protein